MQTAPNKSDNSFKRLWIAFLLISCSTLSTAFSQSQTLVQDTLPYLEPRPVRLTEPQARQAIADRISVPNLTYQVDQLRKAQSTSDTLVTGLLKRIDEQDQTIRRQARQIRAQRAELWFQRSSILATLIGRLIFRK
ncbi:hypothetical protein [Spirosoma oryzicola]|uniref:hypothetical protein n=1 Tax=Spirosoma oryzicola TaxID=2898794 RepID=UPI001E2A8746|nr:hypothetical protein [Spirosoma oryzicola]UHG93305.1 hypothetical protein LQ777_10475 [Spirosoma oryzicola]